MVKDNSKRTFDPCFSLGCLIDRARKGLRLKLECRFKCNMEGTQKYVSEFQHYKHEQRSLAGYAPLALAKFLIMR